MPTSGAGQVALFAVAYLVYFGVRAITEGSVPVADANALKLIRLEREWGIAWEQSLQNAALASPI